MSIDSGPTLGSIVERNLLRPPFKPRGPPPRRFYTGPLCNFKGLTYITPPRLSLASEGKPEGSNGPPCRLSLTPAFGRPARVSYAGPHDRVRRRQQRQQIRRQQPGAARHKAQPQQGRGLKAATLPAFRFHALTLHPSPLWSIWTG
jgi:hypothetical protein